ncbi:hypothetical protein AG1IA_05428 [Rhizoctonia solani AG-1 IA]|uniref:Uncharacterized protein n=1 Tax=Thanatephorus cucumeris (strain AG1-IA) TaxID=983506 RepID=L8WW10_THACA|nr:hypothetical protein AG1IA_05428 [Rhizoctonia solani AG-1 IA]
MKAGTEVTPTSAGERAGQKKNTKTKESIILIYLVLRNISLVTLAKRL